MSRIEICKGDITTIPVDAIVNAANQSLLGGGGVDGAIHDAGGPAILAECRQIRARQGGCPTGGAVITTAGKLPAKYVIHTVGPVWDEFQPDHEAEAGRLLRECYVNSLELAAEHQVESISFPAISTGVYRFPKDQAAEIAFEAVRDFLRDHEFPRKVIFVCFGDSDRRYYEEQQRRSAP